MVTLSLRDPHVIGTLAVSVVAIGGVAAWLMTRRRPSPEEIERERRAHLVRTGRIIDGNILDVTESAVPEPEVTEFDAPVPPQLQEIHFILYKYEIGGVAYESSQDVTTLRDQVRPGDLRLGFPCSVRYDVHRPENSIVVAENWSGLRQTARSVPTRRSAPPRKGRPTPVPTQLSPRD
ncbi:MAG: hypothetical protein WA414_04055 [Acidobacteriaceae bacterium]